MLYHSQLYEILAGQNKCAIKIVFRLDSSISTKNESWAWALWAGTHKHFILTADIAMTFDGRCGPPPFLSNIWWDIGLKTCFKMYTQTVWATGRKGMPLSLLSHKSEWKPDFWLTQHSVNTGDSIMGQTHKHTTVEESRSSGTALFVNQILSV